MNRLEADNDEYDYGHDIGNYHADGDGGELKNKAMKKDGRNMQWFVVEATVTGIYNIGDKVWKWEYKLDIDDDRLTLAEKRHSYNLQKSAFNRKTAPGIGDRVILKNMLTHGTTGFDYVEARIYEKIEEK